MRSHTSTILFTKIFTQDTKFNFGDLVKHIDDTSGESWVITAVTITGGGTKYNLTTGYNKEEKLVPEKDLERTETPLVETAFNIEDLVKFIGDTSSREIWEVTAVTITGEGTKYDLVVNTAGEDKRMVDVPEEDLEEV